MIVAAMLDAGLDVDLLETQLATLPIDDFQLNIAETKRAGLRATSFTPTPSPDQPHRNLTQITDNVDYTPDLTRAGKLRFKVTRPDGFSFPVVVTLPESFQPGNPLPAMFWFYPREYTDQESYDERFRNYNKNTFTNYGTRSMAFLTRLGYAVVEPESPIIGDEGAMNNNYVADLRNNLSAVIDTIVNRGWVDRGEPKYAESIYITLNPVNPALLGRSNNRMQAGVNRTKDEDVPVYHNIFIEKDFLIFM